MARPKKKADTPAADRSVRLDLPPDVHYLLRVVAAHDGKSMATYCRDVVSAAVRDEAKRRGIKP